MEFAIQKFVILSLLIVGLSHVLQPRTWVDFFILLRSKGKVGVFLTAFLHLPVGLLIVGFHNVWGGWPTVITILGWAWTLQGFLYFCFPGIGMWSLSRVSTQRANEFIIPGALFVVLGLYMGFVLPWR